jgi:predicted DNA binding protein
MLRFYPAEVFKQFKIEHKLKLNYAVSNFGRVVSYKDSIENGRFIKNSAVEGYIVFRYKIYTPGEKVKTKHLYVYKLVAEYFLTKTSEDQDRVLHLDFNKSNDFVGNLKWATTAEMREHHKKSPYVIEAKRKLVQIRINGDGNKLTTTQVIWLKKKLLDPNRKTRLKLLAKKFGVSEMTLHRIRTGENWGHIKV